MPITYEKLPDEPIAILTYTNPFEHEAMGPHFAQAAQDAEETAPLYVINDLSQLTVDFGAMMIGMRQASLGGPGTAADPRTRHVLVSTEDIMQAAAEAMKQDQYGGLEVPIFASLDDAFDYVRGKLG